MQSNLLPVADAIVRRLAEVIAPTFPSAEVLVTWTDERFDVKTTNGLKVYVTPLSDVPGSFSEGGTRDPAGRQPLRYVYAISFVERKPSTIQGADATDLWTRERIEVVGQCRHVLDNPAGFELPGVEGIPLVPVQSEEREAVDLEYLRAVGVFGSGFKLTIREDA